MSAKEQKHSENKVSSKQHPPKNTANTFGTAAKQSNPPAALFAAGEFQPGSLTAGNVVQLQRVAGNGAVSRALSNVKPHPVIQAKLTVGAAHDPYEQEADRVADQVMRMHATPTTTMQRTVEDEEELQAKPLASTLTPLVQRATPEIDEEELQTKRATAADGFDTSADFEGRLNATRGSGSPLPDSVREFMEPRFGADFSGVRLHTGSESTQLNREVSAQAFTLGQDIYLGEGKRDLESSAGKQLLAHELTHVVQQNEPPGAIQPLSVQRKLGLELELNVLVDHDKEDAGTATDMGKVDGVELKTDHNKNLQADKGKGKYTSIVELVTGAYEFEALSRVDTQKSHHIEQLREDLLTAKEIAEKIEAGTNGFKTEKALDSIFSDAEPDFSVGVDPKHLKSGTQNLEAYIQASFGADLAQLTQLFAWAQSNEAFETKPMPDRVKGTKVGTTVKRDEDEKTILSTAPTVATQIMQALNWQDDSKEFQELHGLLTIMSMYLILGLRHPKMATRSVIDKNIAPFLSRTPLNDILNRLMGSGNSKFLKIVGVPIMNKSESVAATILQLTGRKWNDHLIPEFTTTPQCGPWVVAVLNEKSDDFTTGLDSGDFKTFKEEGIGPDTVAPSEEKSSSSGSVTAFGHTFTDPKTKGPVLELRHPAKLGGLRYPPNEWMAFTEYLAKSLQKLNTPKKS